MGEGRARLERAYEPDDITGWLLFIPGHLPPGSPRTECLCLLDHCWLADLFLAADGVPTETHSVVPVSPWA